MSREDSGCLEYCPECDLFVTPARTGENLSPPARRRPWLRWRLLAAIGSVLLLGSAIAFYYYDQAARIEAAGIDNEPRPVADSDSGAQADLGPPLVIEPRPYSDEGVLQYRFKVGQKLRYEINYAIERDGRRREFQGETTYTVRPVTEELIDRSCPVEWESKEAAGFVIHSDGYLLTTAGAVIGASRVEAMHDGAVYDAQVIAIDRSRDLAVLHIDRRGIKPVAFANAEEELISKTVQVQEMKPGPPIQASLKGKPNAPVLWANLSDYRDWSSHGDAVFDRRGAVVAVTATLWGRPYTVGEQPVIPISAIRALLDEVGIPVRSADSSASPVKDGPFYHGRSLVSIHAIVNCKDTIAIDCESRLPTDTSLRFTVWRQPDEWYPDPGKTLVFDRFGQLVGYSPRSSLPMFLQSPELIAIEPFDLLGREVWWLGPDGVPFRSNLSKHDYAGGGRESNAWEIIDRSNDHVLISKRTVATAISSYDEPSWRFNLHGASSIQFDQQIGAIREIYFSGVLHYWTDEGDSQVELTLTCKLAEISNGSPNDAASQSP